MNRNERDRLLRQIAAVDFAMIELHLFMDSHPNDREAGRKLDEYEKKSTALRKEFEEKYGPLTSMQKEGNRWAWNCDPWTWVNEED